MPKPVFISLVGSSDYMKGLYQELKSAIPERFPDKRFTALEDPFKDYADMRIGGRPKRSFTPEARVCFRWGLFVEYNAKVVAPAFKAADIVLVPRFGFDLYAGAVRGNLCDAALRMHIALVPFGVTGVGAKPPVYLFRRPLSTEDEKLREAYFAHPGQRYKDLNSELFTIGDIEDTLDLISSEFAAYAETEADISRLLSA